MVRRVSSSIFVGRVVERAGLVAALEAAGRGEPGVVLLGGEAGIGKSRLASELLATARVRGARVVRGHCLGTKAVSLPFAPWIEVLRDLIRADEESAIDGVPASERTELARLVPELRTGSGAGSELAASADNPVHLFHAVFDLVRRAAADAPLVVLLEDLHWADPSSLDLLRFIATGLTGEPLLVVATFRDDEIEGQHSLQAALAELARLPNVVRLDLRPFDRREVADQLTGIGGRVPGPDVVDRIFDRSDGNPFLVEELAGQKTDGPLPPTLRDVMAARLSTLSPDTRRVVSAAAAIGRDVGRDLLTTIMAIPEKRVLQVLGEAMSKHVLVRGGGHGTVDYAFRHALIQEFAYGELVPSDRRALHAAIAMALAAAQAPSGEIARHARLAGDLPVALARTVDAARQAIDALAFAEALAHVQQALALWGEVPDPQATAGVDRPRLLGLGARCAVAVGDWEQAVVLRRQALGDFGPERRAERAALLMDLADSLAFTGDWPGSTAAVKTAAELVPIDPPTPLRARIVANLADSDLDEGRIDDGRRLASEALEIARACGDATEAVRALLVLAQTFTLQHHYQTAADLLAEADQVVTARSVNDEFVVATLFARRAMIANMTGNSAAAMEMTEQALARAKQAGTLAQQRPFLRWRTLTACVSLGRWLEAQALVDAARHDTTPMQYQWTVDIFLEALIRQGRLAEAQEAVRSTDHGYDTPFQGAWVLQARIRLANALGRWADARAAAEEVIALFPSGGEGFLFDHLPDMIRGEADRAEAAEARRRKAEAIEARQTGLDRLERLRRILRDPIEMGGAGRLVESTLAMAEAEGSRLRGQSAPALWAEAAARSAALPQPWETAYARFRQAEAMLAAHEDRRAVLSLLRDARRVASELGAVPLVNDVERLARRARLRLEDDRQERKSHAINDAGVVVTITNREREVLSLVAAGHTNREIGESLFISEKTASVHITNAMDKLGALSRYDAAASASRLGLIGANEAIGDAPAPAGRMPGG